MVPPNMIPYVVMAGTLLVAIAAPIFMGLRLWYVPFVLIPFLILYFLYDRSLARKEREGGGGH